MGFTQKLYVLTSVISEFKSCLNLSKSKDFRKALDLKDGNVHYEKNNKLFIN